METYISTRTVGTRILTLLLHDFSGTPEEREREVMFGTPLSSAYYGADLGLLCYSPTDVASFLAIKERWAPLLRSILGNEFPLYLIATKADIVRSDPDTAFVSVAEGKALCKEIGALKFLSVSSKEYDSVSYAFHSVMTFLLYYSSTKPDVWLCNSCGATNFVSMTATTAKRCETCWRLRDSGVFDEDSEKTRRETTELDGDDVSNDASNSDQSEDENDAKYSRRTEDDDEW
eukprot:TRINITY_DN15119_c0_g1_i1.p1 TRINITY_DN15119_c0_g1~~TRINITY_DN15119_c0_g1_i1.p1  ORF type:complete len:258 (-),score=44.57 TRINITY_DN15119_c0_g1_i1:89-784(-)